ncbi:hypothetical protein D3C73_1561840 [compost metagenome]
MVAEHASGFGGGDGACMSVKQLLAQGLLHQLDLSGDRRGRQAFAAGHFGKTAVIEHCDKQPERLESQFIEAVHD